MNPSSRIAFFIVLLILLARVYPAPAQSSGPSGNVIDVWPESKMPGKSAAEQETELPPRGDNVTRITNISHPTLTLFKAPGNGKRTAAMIVCPGGGYNYVTYNKEGTAVAAWLNAAGITAFVLKYRTPQNRDGALQDTQRAVSLVRARASEWNIDKKRIGIIGFSAGGNLAAKASTLFDHRTYSLKDDIDKQSSRPDFVVLVYPAYLDKDGIVSTDLDLKARIPPTLIVHTEDDKTYVTGSKLYHAALDQAKIKNKFLLYGTGGHGYGLISDKEARVWPDETLQWLNEMKISGR
jgi:acetyl esterase/lipase